MAAMPNDTMRDSESLSDAIIRQLIAVPQSHNCNMAIWPCQATLRDGRVLPRVLFLRSKQYYEGSDYYVPASQVVAVSESPFRLPAMWANVVYAHGESGMDYFMFRVFFRDDTHMDVTICSFVDFIPYPGGKTATDVLRVEHWRRLKPPFDERSNRPSYPIFKCVFDS